MIKTPQLAAHYRLMESLPKKTHIAKQLNLGRGSRVPQAMSLQIRKLKAEGLETEEIARILGIATSTVNRHLRPIE